MTYILNHDVPARSTFPVATLAHLLVSASSVAAGIAQALWRIPVVVATAFTMAYVDPYQPSSGANDPADPRNF